MRADRLLSMLLILQTQGRQTASDLAKKLDVSERTIYRDADALGMAGIPIVSERGSGGGLSLLESYRVSLNGLKSAEIQTLFLGKPSRLLADLGLEDSAEQALMKLTAALPVSRVQDADFIRQRIYIDGAGWQQTSENILWLPVIQTALWQGRQIILSYERSDNMIVERQVSPLGLVSKGVLWYLIAAIESDIRTYRISRIQQVVIISDTAIRPDDFDLAQFWQDSSAAFVQNLPRYHVILKVRSEALKALQMTRWSRIEQVDLPDEAGWQRVEVNFEVEEAALQALAGMGDQVQILAPVTLIHQLLSHARQIIALYL